MLYSLGFITIPVVAPRIVSVEEESIIAAEQGIDE